MDANNQILETAKASGFGIGQGIGKLRINGYFQDLVAFHAAITNPLLKRIAELEAKTAQPAQGTQAVPDEVAKKAARYDYLKTHRNVLLLTGFFGNGCMNRAIAEVESIIDAALATAPKPPAVQEGEPT